MLAIPPFGASSNIALLRADNKPPVELVVANLVCDAARYEIFDSTAFDCRCKLE
jgi:hypothetical protein